MRPARMRPSKAGTRPAQACVRAGIPQPAPADRPNALKGFASSAVVPDRTDFVRSYGRPREHAFNAELAPNPSRGVLMAELIVMSKSVVVSEFPIMSESGRPGPSNPNDASLSGKP